MMKNVTPFLAVAMLVGSLGLSACNTVAGAGEDLEQAGDHIEQRAEDLNDGNPNTP